MLPSKELLSAVYKKPDSIFLIDKKYDKFFIEMPASWKEISPYEFAAKCKEWANENELEYELVSFKTKHREGGFWVCEVYINYHGSSVYGEFEKDFVGNSEPEVVFKACEWILEKKQVKK